MIKLILSDLTGVVITGGHKKLCKILSDKYHIPADELYSVIYTEYFNKFATNQITEQQAYDGPIQKFSFKETWQELADMLMHVHKTNAPMIKLIKKLKEKYQMILLTKNIPRYLQWYKQEFFLEDLFHDIINTYDIHLPKASEETIRHVLDKYQVKPGEVVYIDDQEENLKQANKIGVHTILYENFNQVEQEILCLTN